MEATAPVIQTLILCLFALSFVCGALAFILYLRRIDKEAPPARTTSERPAQHPAGVNELAPVAAVEPRGSLPYVRQSRLLTVAEQEFFDALCAATPNDWYVFPQVRLANLVEVARGTRNWRPHFSRIAAKCVDFVFCEPTNLSPRLVVELDDSSHQRPDRRARDQFVDAALAAAGLPILHMRWQRRFDLARLAGDIRAAAGLPALSASEHTPQPSVERRAALSHTPQARVERPAAPLPVLAPQGASVMRWPCRSCGLPVTETAKFCTGCGAPLALRS